MLFLKKRIPLEMYCEGMFKHIYSRHYDEVADKLLETCPTTFREVIDRDWYLKNFRAAVLELLGVTFSRNLKRGQRIEAHIHVSCLLTESGLEEVERLHKQYNSAFGSDSDDGVSAMASLFARNCVCPDTDPVHIQELHYDAFYEILDAFFKNIKSVKVV